MFYADLLIEAPKSFLPVTPENLAAAKQFVFAKWQARAKELGHDEPVDLTSACKFASLFAAEVFGGQVRGNFFHQWVALPNGQRLDLNDEAQDVTQMVRGEIPADTQAYAQLSRQRLPQPLYTHDQRHMASRDNRDSMASIRPRVAEWVAEFLHHRVVEDFDNFQLNRIDPVKPKQKPLSGSMPDTAAFKAWFGKSKIVDRKGQPMPVFHGRKLDFMAFDPSKAKDHRPNTMFFATDPDVASSYSGQYTSMTGHRTYQPGANVLPVYLRILRPLVINARGDSWNNILFKGEDWSTNDLTIYARQKGYDGLVIKNLYDIGEGLTKPSTVIIAYSPNQVKSVFNSGWRSDSDHLSEDDEAPSLMSWANEVERKRPIQPVSEPKREKFKSGKVADFYQQVLRDGGDMFGADQDELPLKEVKQWVATHRKLFQSGGITVYRTMQLTPAEFTGIKPGAELGNHWTYEFDDSNIEGFNVDFNNTAKQFYVFEATVRTGEVAFPLTVAYNVYFPHEKEIFLDYRLARPKIVSVRYFNTHHFMLDDENLRPDLVGVEMRA